MRVVFMGTPDFAVPTLAALIAAGHDVVAVYSQPPRPAGRGKKLQPSPVQIAAEAAGIAVLTPDSLRGGDEQVAFASHRADVAVVAAYGLILPPAVLATPVHGCLNVHGSILPRWRGAAPVQRAILAGDDETGVTIMQMDAGLDTGPILAERSLAIGTATNAATLAQQLAALGAELLCATLPEFAAGRIAPRAQPAQGATYAAKLYKAEARIDWQHSASTIALQVRAFNPWPVADTLLGGAQLRLWEAAAIDGPTKPAAAAAAGTVLGVIDGALQVACGSGVLAIRQLQPAGRRVMSAPELLNSAAAAGSLIGQQLG